MAGEANIIYLPKSIWRLVKSRAYLHAIIWPICVLAYIMWALLISPILIVSYLGWLLYEHFDSGSVFLRPSSWLHQYYEYLQKRVTTTTERD